MQDTNQNESALIERAINGDVDAFGDLYSLHLDAIYRYVFYRTGDVEDSEDITEQVFLKAWEALDGYRNEGKPFTSWLYRIAHDAVIDYHRKSKKNVVSVEMLKPAELIQPQPGTLQQVIHTEEIQALASALSQLSGEQQQVVILRFIEGFSHREVAQILDKNEGACRMIQYRALLALQDIMKD